MARTKTTATVREASIGGIEPDAFRHAPARLTSVTAWFPSRPNLLRYAISVLPLVRREKPTLDSASKVRLLDGQSEFSLVA